jgi:phosphatidylglycerol:prolipoprotein diacylglycerol transferase
MASPLSLFSPNPDLFDPLGAIAGAVLTVFVLVRRQKLPILDTLDALTAFFAVLSVGIALMHLAAGTAFGQPTGLPWGMELWGARRHPSQIYESLAAMVILMAIWLSKYQFRSGILFLIFSALTAGARLFLEAFRGDSVLVAGGLRQAQFSAWIILAACFIMIEVLQSRKHTGETSSRED